MLLLIKCSSPFVAHCHPRLRAPPHVCCHVCREHAWPCLSTGWMLNRRFDLTFGTAAVLAQGGGGRWIMHYDDRGITQWFVHSQNDRTTQPFRFLPMLGTLRRHEKAGVM